MKYLLPVSLILAATALVARAEPEDNAPPATGSGPATPAEVPPLALAAMAAAASAPRAVTGEARFTSQDRWEHAGYNLDEIVYTVFITNRDSRILRCRTQVHGIYINNGEKNELTDLQTTTVYPNKQEQAGIWSGLDEPSGATFKVTCKPIAG